MFDQKFFCLDCFVVVYAFAVCIHFTIHLPPAKIPSANIPINKSQNQPTYYKLPTVGVTTQKKLCGQCKWAICVIMSRSGRPQCWCIKINLRAHCVAARMRMSISETVYACLCVCEPITWRVAGIIIIFCFLFRSIACRRNNISLCCITGFVFRTRSCVIVSSFTNE